jgi:hypothetical protein
MINHTVILLSVRAYLITAHSRADLVLPAGVRCAERGCLLQLREASL